MVDSGVFPYDIAHFPWGRDNYGPITIPKKGATMTLSPQNIALYHRIIETYEHNTLEEKTDRYFINGKPTNQYTFTIQLLLDDGRQPSPQPGQPLLGLCA